MLYWRGCGMRNRALKLFCFAALACSSQLVWCQDSARCPVRAFTFAWERDQFPGKTRFSFTAFGADRESALKWSRAICASLGLHCVVEPIWSRELGNACARCFQVDLSALRWDGGNKTEFCKAHGFDGTFGYPGYGYNLGTCYVGPGCPAVGTGLR